MIDKLKLLIALGVLSAGLAIGWTAQGWRKDAAIDRINAARASDRAVQAEGALTDLTAAAKKINDAALALAASDRTLDARLDTLTTELKHERKKNPLPADCKPNAERMRSLAAAVDAANKAASGQ